MYKICFTVDSSYVGGAEHYVEQLVRGLDRARFAPAILARRADGLEVWLERVEAAGTPVRTVRMGLPFRPMRAAGLWRALRSLAPDIVHINMPGPYDGQMGLLAPLAKLAGARCVVTTEHLPMVERLWKRALVKRLSMNFVDRVFTVSRANIDYLVSRQRIAPKRITAVYNGVPGDYGTSVQRATVRRELGLGEDAIALVIVGSMSYRKGPQTLLQALESLDIPHWQLFVVGDGPDRPDFETQASRYGIDGRVRFLGHLAEPDVEKLLPAMDVLALPSFMEGLPYVILEAMACGLPVVASDIYGIPEAAVHNETALLVPPGDAASLRDALRTLILDPDMRRSLGERGRVRFERLFTLDRHVASMETLYTELLEGAAE